MKNKELGFAKESVMYAYIGAEGRNDSRKFDIIKNRLEQIPEIESASVSWNIPFHSSSGTNVTWEGAQPNETINARYNFVGHDYFDTYGLKLVEGRFFSRDFSTDTSEAVVINETAARAFEWENPIDKKVEFWGKNYKVIGVVKDFHPFSVFQKIPPFVFRLHDENIDGEMHHSVKIASQANILETKAKINALYKEIYPNTLFDFKYYGNETDDAISVIYNGIVKTFLFFSLITISIAVVGMFGLVAFSTKSRTKEIGIRKVHGASIRQIFVLLAREFVVLIVIAIVISMPAGVGFKAIDPAAYKAETGIWEYALTGTIVILVTLFTISWHTNKASRQNPTEALRYE